MESGIHKAMIAIMLDVGVIGKNSKNTQQGYSFRGIDTVYNELHSVMAKNGVYTIPEVIEERHTERKSANNKTLVYCIAKIKYTFYCEDGSSVFAIVIGEGMDSGDKASNKAMAVAHKYALLQSFCIPTDEPKDPEIDSHEITSTKNNNIDEF
jgi:hypothetical protein